MDTHRPRDSFTLSVAPTRPPLLLSASLGLVSGIILDYYIVIPPAWAMSAMTLAALAVIALPARRYTPALTVLALAGLGAVLHHRAYYQIPSDHIVHQTLSQPRMARLCGTILTEPMLRERRLEPFDRWFYDTQRTAFVMNAESVDAGNGPTPITGQVAVFVKEAIDGPGLGDRIEIIGHLYRPSPPENPGSFDWERHYRCQGIWAAISAPLDECVRVIDEPSSRGGLINLWHRLRYRVGALFIENRLGDDEQTSGLLQTMVLGRRHAVDPHINEMFIRTGCVHYLAVSGSNIAILGLFVWRVAQFLGASLRTATTLAMIAALAYLFLVDPLPPIVRATVMALTCGTTVLLRRPRNLAHALILSGFLMLLAQPTLLFDVSFQLTFTCMFGLAYVAPALIHLPKFLLTPASSILSAPIPPSRIPPRLALWLRPARHALVWALAVSIASWLTSLPLSAYYFERFSLGGWFNSVLVLPLVSLLTLLGFVVVLIAPLSAALVVWPNILLSGLAGLLLALVEWLDQWTSFNLNVPAPPVGIVLLYYALLTIGVVVVHGKCRRRWLVAAAGALGICITGWLAWPIPRDGLTMTVLSVGRGTAIVLELPDGRTLLYDAGTSKPYDVGINTIVPYLRYARVGKLDAAVISHPDLDHFSGILSVVDRIKTGPILVNPFFESLAGNQDGDNQPATVLLNELETRGRKLRSVRRGDTVLSGDGLSLEVLWPPDPPPFPLETNDSSLVLRIRYGSSSILLCGDIEKGPQQWLLDHESLHADVLILPHHGSEHTSLSKFISAVGAKIMIESSATRHEEPDTPYVAHEMLPDSDHYNTADHGAIKVILSQTGIHVWTLRPNSVQEADNKTSRR